MASFLHHPLLQGPRRFNGKPAPKLPKRLTIAEQLAFVKTAKGGYTKAALAVFGVPWPPPKGWKKKLLAPAE